MSNARFRLRVWDGIHKKMVYGKKLKFHTWFNELSQLDKLSERIIMQFTGLTDSDGELVWEGDIVSVLGRPQQIRWCKECAAFHYGSMPHHFGTNNKFGECIKVLGNIYENPELLGQAAR